ncbi:MAG: S8 family serine peptidase [bacterium]
MKKKILFTFLIFNIFFFSNHLWAREIKKAFIIHPKTNRKVSVVADEFLVKFKREVEKKIIDKINKKFGVEIKKKLRIKNLYLLKVPPSKTINEMLKKYREDPNVEFAVPNYIRKAFTADPHFGQQWGITQIHAPEAWDTETGKGSIVIAILDTGVDYDHEDLEDNIWINKGEIPGNGQDDDGNSYIDDDKGWNFVNEDDDPDDDHNQSHGTHCAGIAAAVTNNGIGIAGVSWKSKIMAVKVLDANGEGTLDDELEGIDYAVTKGAHIISMSFGTTGYPPTPNELERQAIDDAYNKGCLLVAASGNDNKPYVAYPAAYDNVIAVGASNPSDERWGSSNYGPQVDVVAPGVNILSTVRMGTGLVDSNYGPSWGTSMATPFVSGLAALILSHLGGLAPSDVRRIIEKTADDIGSSGWDQETGWGRIDAYSALTAYYVAGNIVHMTMNYPNPFKPREENYTTIYFTTKRAVVDKSIGIYNLAGEMVLDVEGSSIYMDKWYDDGYVYKYNWDGRNDYGERVASGIYIYVVNADGNRKAGKLAVIK